MKFDLSLYSKRFPELSQKDLAAILVRWDKTIRKDCCPEWEDPDCIISFCQEEGYESGCAILRIDDALPFSPDNCYLDFSRCRDPQKPSGWYKTFAERWNARIYLPNRKRMADYRAGKRQSP